jgi:hypothetical protein
MSAVQTGTLWRVASTQMPTKWGMSDAIGFERDVSKGIPNGEPPTSAPDIEVFFDRLPEPIDLELDITNRVLYWTGRGDPPRGNTAPSSRLILEPPSAETGEPGH